MSEHPSSLSSGASPLRQRLVVGLVGLVVVLLAAWLSLIVVSRIDALFFPGQEIGGLPSLPGVQQDSDGPAGQINILVLGLDRRPREGTEPSRTDTMFILTIDASSKTAGILGIPRDLWVEIPFREGEGFYEARVNTAYLVGEQQDYAGGGPGLVQTVIEHNLGIPIDHYVVIDFEGFVEMIDQLGGIDLYVETEINDPFYSRTELPGDYFPLYFEVGEQHMDGATALDYSRTRFGSDDLDRIRRQQQVIFAAIDKALELDLVDVDNLLNLWKRYRGAVETDINDLQAPGFASLAAKIDPTRISALSLGAATRPWITPEGAAVLLIDQAMVQQLVLALFSDRQLSEEAAVVEVQNGAGADGLATSVVEYLAAFGFSVNSLTAANTTDGSVHPLTEIIDFSGKDYTVERLASLLTVPPEQIRQGGAEDQVLRTVGDADILVILGADVQAQDFTVGIPGG